MAQACWTNILGTLPGWTPMGPLSLVPTGFGEQTWHRFGSVHLSRMVFQSASSQSMNSKRCWFLFCISVESQALCLTNRSTSAFFGVCPKFWDDLTHQYGWKLVRFWRAWHTYTKHVIYAMWKYDLPTKYLSLILDKEFAKPFTAYLVEKDTWNVIGSVQWSCLVLLALFCACSEEPCIAFAGCCLFWSTWEGTHVVVAALCCCKGDNLAQSQSPTHCLNQRSNKSKIIKIPNTIEFTSSKPHPPKISWEFELSCFSQWSPSVSTSGAGASSICVLFVEGSWVEKGRV